MSLIWFTGHNLGAEELRKDRWQADIPVEAFNLNEQGKELIKKAQYDAAAKKLEQALRIKADYYAATFNLAVALDFREAKGDDTLAEDYFRKAVTIAERQNFPDVALYNTFGWFLHLRGRLKEAEEFYKKALELDPKNPRVLNNLGSVYELSDDLNAAKKFYRLAIQNGSNKARENLSRLERIKP